MAHGQMPERELETGDAAFRRSTRRTCWSPRRSSRTVWTSRGPTRSSSIAPTASAWPSCTSFAAASAAATSTPTPTSSCPAGITCPTTRGKRLRALQEFSELGAGFRLAAADLEIRGAGELLGARQHGHIASLGFRPLLPDAGTGRAGNEGRAGRRAAAGQPAPRRGHQGSGELPAGVGGPAGGLQTAGPGPRAPATSTGCRPRPRTDSATCPRAASNLFDMGRLRLLAEEAGVKSIDLAEDEAADPLPGRGRRSSRREWSRWWRASAAR